MAAAKGMRPPLCCTEGLHEGRQFAAFETAAPVIRRLLRFISACPSRCAVFFIRGTAEQGIAGGFDLRCIRKWQRCWLRQRRMLSFGQIFRDGPKLRRKLDNS